MKVKGFFKKKCRKSGGGGGARELTEVPKYVIILAGMAHSVGNRIPTQVGKTREKAISHDTQTT